MRNALINNKSLICNVTLDSANWKTFKPHFENFIFSLPEKDVTLKPFEIEAHIEREGLTIPAQVNYVGKAADLYALGYEFDASAEVITAYLRMAYLWEKIRVQGGAYGAFSVFDGNSGVFSFLSYRDPNLDATLENYDKAADYLKNLNATSFNDNELTKAIIGTIGDRDAYQLPDAKGYTSMMRYLTGRTDEMLQKERDQILSTNGEDFIAFGEILEKAAKSEAIAVIGSQSAIEGAKAGLKVTKVLLNILNVQRLTFQGANMNITLKINGSDYSLDIAPSSTLLSALRGLGFHGVKFGDEGGLSGSDTVLLDGKPVNAGSLLAAQAEGHKVATIEALGEHPEQGWKLTEGLHPLQKAFVETGAIQCGYCTPAQILAAKSLLEKNPNPSEAEVREAISGVLCRCTGYLKPVQAVLKAAAEMRGDTPLDWDSINWDFGTPKDDAPQSDASATSLTGVLIRPKVVVISRIKNLANRRQARD